MVGSCRWGFRTLPQVAFFSRKRTGSYGIPHAVLNKSTAVAYHAPMWLSPIPLALVPSSNPLSFRDLGAGQTALPLDPHPGAFGVVRKHHTHEGVDLYAPEGTLVSAVEAGQVVRIEPFTGSHAGSSWWHDTWAVFVEGASGVVVYGEIQPKAGLVEGARVEPGQVLGRILQVLKTPKGRPATMLHLELHAPGTRSAPGWDHGQPRPATLLDPTPWLLALVNRAPGPDP